MNALTGRTGTIRVTLAALGDLPGRHFFNISVRTRSLKRELQAGRRAVSSVRGDT